MDDSKMTESKTHTRNKIREKNRDIHSKLQRSFNTSLSSEGVPCKSS